MCKPDTSSSSSSSIPPLGRQQPLRFLLSVKSYERGSNSGQGPDAASVILTGLVFILFLVLSERLCLQWLYNHQDIHALLEDDLHRRILARHVGVDTLACFVCACMGFAKMRTYSDLWNTYVRGEKGAFVRANYMQRISAYDPAAFRICLWFFAYQVKNLYDTIIFDDGAIFIFHHVFSAITAYGCFGPPKIVHYYPFFFVGLSEVSTAVLCLLANFDPVHGVVGLGEAFPTVKMILAGLFVVTFLVCRIITWPIISYHFVDDILLALRHHKDDPRIIQRKPWYYFHLISNASLTVLQFVWLIEIGFTAHREMVAFGMI